MFKRIIAAMLAALLMTGLISCGKHPPIDTESTTSFSDIASTEIPTATESSTLNPKLPQERLYYVIQTDWMTLCFLKKDFKEEEVAPIAEEAVRVMADVRNFLGVNYSLEDAKDTYCYFNKSYLNKVGEARSACYYLDKEMFCRSVGDFVHEYAHMVSMCSSDLLYLPDTVFLEGFAQYVGVNFDERIASEKYEYFSNPEKEIPPLEKLAEDEKWICERISALNLPFTDKYIEKAQVAYIERYSDQMEIDEDSVNYQNYYNYYVGMVLSEYCIDNLGGMEKFMQVFGDSVTLSEVYGKTFDTILEEALKSNAAFFGDSLTEDTEPPYVSEE